MRTIKLVLAAAAFAAAAAGITACGDSKGSAPTQPSATPSISAPAPSVSGASIGGTVVGTAGISAASFRTLGVTLTVSVTGTNVSSTVDAAGRFRLQGVPAGRVELHFVGSGVDARLVIDNVAANEAIEIVVRVNGAVAEIENNQRQTPDNRVEIEGLVTAVGAGTLTVRNTVVTVPATATIRGHSGTTMRLADIKVGDRVEIHGTMNGATVVAADIEVENEAEDHGNPGPNPGPGTGTPPPGDDHGHGDDHGEAEASGTVAGKGGTCPSIHFTIGSTTVQTSGSTEFRDVTCSALANGNRVEVKGTRASASSTTINATRVEKK